MVHRGLQDAIVHLDGLNPGVVPTSVGWWGGIVLLLF